MNGGTTQVIDIPVAEIAVVSNPRSDYGNIDELAADIASRGLLEPLLVRSAPATSISLFSF